MEETNQIPLTALDRIADGDGLQMIKAAIPYMPPAVQKSLSLYVKVLEINNISSYYSSPMRACSAPKDNPSPEEILCDLKKYGSDAQRQSLDQALNLITTLKMYQECKDLL